MKHYLRLAKQKGIKKMTKGIVKYKQKRRTSINTYIYRHRGSILINALQLATGNF